ncbi:MAG TPA: sterol desaturase family protein [Chitinophagales bacterium]|nr:sterol desaturase family protein [Chitinophagales bacterium]
MLTKIVFALSGIIFWTFLEYIIHRFFGHAKHGQGPIRKEHLMHHAKAHYFAPMYKKGLLALLVLSGSTFIMGLSAGWMNGLLFSTGLAGMYLLYESAHRLYHTHEPLVGYGLKMRKHHFYHHFVNPRYNHGVTTAFWDRLFNTYKASAQVPVPEKMAMPWLIEDETGLKLKYASDFRLV